MTTTSVRIIGTQHGSLWMGGHSWMDVDVTEYRNGPRQRIIDSTDPTYRTDLRAMLDGIITGDFQDGTLSSDSYIIVRRERTTPTGRIVRERVVDITALPSVADYVSGCDGHDYGED